MSRQLRLEHPGAILFGGLGWKEEKLTKRLKADAEKVRIAARLPQETTMTLQSIAEELQMGSWTYLSNNLAKISRRSVSQCSPPRINHQC